MWESRASGGLFQNNHLLAQIVFFAISMVLVLHAVPLRSQEVNQDSLHQLLEQYEQPDSLRLEVLLKLAAVYKNSIRDKSESYLQEALEIAEVQQLPFQKAVIKREFIEQYALGGEIEAGIKVGLESIRIFDSLGRKDQTLITQGDLIPIYASAGYHQKALELSLQSLELVQDDPETPSKGMFYFNVGKSYRDLKAYPEALSYFDQARKLCERVNFRAGIAVTSLNMATCKISLEQFEEAKQLLLGELPYFREIRNENLLTSALESLGDIAAEQANHQLAIAYYEEAMTYFKALGFVARIQDVSMKLFIQYSIIGRKDLAKASEEKYKALRDSLQYEETNKIVGELQTKYETEKKEAAIEALTQQTTIQELTIVRRNQMLIIGLVIALLIAGIAYFLYYQQTMSRQRKQAELEQRFLRSQLNPHFISNALITVQASLYDKDTEAAESYLELFARLMRKILENSREEFIPVEDEIEMVKDYLELNKRRLNDAFDYVIEVDEAIDEEMDNIPPMFIQPFVENAIEHGLKPDERGLITVKLSQAEESIRLEIEDNGTGILESEYKTSKRSLSTTIIKERIDLYNRSLKNKIKLLIENRTDNSGNPDGTRVALHVPVR